MPDSADDFNPNGPELRGPPGPAGLYQCPCCYGPSDSPGWCRPCLALGFLHSHDDAETAT